MPNTRTSLRPLLADAGDLVGRHIHAADVSVPLAALAHASVFGGRLGELAGRNVLLATSEQLHAGLALIELDGVARRIVLCPPDLKPEHLAQLVPAAGLDAMVTDRDPAACASLEVPVVVPCGLPLTPASPLASDCQATEWIMLTSGTTGMPKMVVHSRAGLTGAIVARGALARDGGGAVARPPVWGTFYDIRRYGGLQIFFRALLGTGSLVLSSAGEDVVDHLGRLARQGVTHQTGTPSHWRRALMSPAATLIDPDYIRLSGEIADQAVLDNLRRTYPRASIGHAYASTEAGVGFEVMDEREGFPATYLDRAGDVAMKVEDGSLRIRSARTGARYLGTEAPPLVDEEGFVDTDDLVALRGDRCHFVGRRSGVINVGGLKVHPEEVEAVINRHGRVRMSLVKAKANAITGLMIVADAVLVEGDDAASPAVTKSEILELCRGELAQHKVPVLVRFTPSLAMTTAGKLARTNA